MTDKEFKRLSRAQLIDVIYQLQLQADAQTKRIRDLEKALADKHFRISVAGNIAEAALEVNEVFQTAQKAADQYLDGVRTLREKTEEESKKTLDDARNEAESILEAARTQAQQIREEAQAEAQAVVADAKDTQGRYDSAIEAILKEYGQTDAKNG